MGEPTRIPSLITTPMLAEIIGFIFAQSERRVLWGEDTYMCWTDEYLASQNGYVSNTGLIFGDGKNCGIRTNSQE